MAIKLKRFYLIGIVLLFCANNIVAQEVIKDTVISIQSEDINAPIVDSTEVVVSPTEDYVHKKHKGDFTIIDADNIVLIAPRTRTSDTINVLKQKDDFWYVNADIKKEESKKTDFWGWLYLTMKKPMVKAIAWIIIIGLLLTIVILYLRNNQLGFFASSAKKIKSEEITDNISDNIFEIDFDAAIAKAIAQSDFRLATRLFFLRLLKTMTEKNILEYAADKTNFDYLFTLSNTKYYTAFATAARNYEYIWYGNFEVNAQQFATIKQGFENFELQLRN